MPEKLQIDGIDIAVTRKRIKHMHLAVHPPQGRVTLSLPRWVKLAEAQAFVLTKLRWLRQQQEKQRRQPRETPCALVDNEIHDLWGQRYLLRVVERAAAPTAYLDPPHIVLCVRPGSDLAKREAVLLAWHKALLREHIPPLISKWEERLGVRVQAWYLQQMKTRWGSCNHRAAHIRLNTELVKKPHELVEYVVVHELVHLLEPSHNHRFAALLDKHFPTWRTASAALNALPPNNDNNVPDLST